MNNNYSAKNLRLLASSSDEYGWEQAQNLGVDKALNQSSDNTYKAFMDGAFKSQWQMSEKGVSKKANAGAVTQAAAKQYLASGMGSQTLRKAADDEYRSAMAGQTPKNTIPLSTYLEKHDQYDRSRGTYSTTGMLANSAPNQSVKNVQALLNQNYVTDKYGESLKVDGIWGPKTESAAAKAPKLLSFDDLSSQADAMTVGKQDKSEGKTEISAKKKEKGSQIIRDNKDEIIKAGEVYGVNPAILAACIYTEQTQNVNWRDTLTDSLLHDFDTSIGIGQVKVSTAKEMEDKGYIMKTRYVGKREEWHGNNKVMRDVWYAPGYGNVVGSREDAIAKRLTVDSESIGYVAAYLAYWQDRWKDEYPTIDGSTAVLATLYNQGETRPPHPNPEPTQFGEDAKASYHYMRELLELD